MAKGKPYKIVYCTPALYMAGGVERVLTYKANYFADHLGYDITIILTEGKGKPFFYPLSDKIKIINLDIGFEVLWTCSFLKKIFIYLKKQHQYKKKLTSELMRIKPDITISLLRREINFITKIRDGSKKIGELHVNRANYRNFESNDTNLIKNLFSRLWMRDLVRHLQKLDKFVTLTEEDKLQWHELDNVYVIPNPLSFQTDVVSPMTSKRVIAVGRYVFQKGFDLLLHAWSQVEKNDTEWELTVFGQGNRKPYEQMMDNLGVDKNRCHLNGPVNDIRQEYFNSSIFVFSSRFEGFGMVLVEAMACGLPVVSFDCPCGPKDIITDTKNGLLIENGNVGNLALGLLQLINDNSLRIQMSREAKKSVKKFEIKHIAEKWIDLFDSL